MYLLNYIIVFDGLYEPYVIRYSNKYSETYNFFSFDNNY